MKLSECVDIFWEVYSIKESEWSLSDAERFGLLETRYPSGAVLITATPSRVMKRCSAGTWCTRCTKLSTGAVYPISDGAEKI